MPKPTAIGLAALQPFTMTPEQVADLLERARANTAPHRIESGRRTRERWDRHRTAKARR